MRIQSLAKEGSGVAGSCGVDLRSGSDLALLWLWCKLAAVAPIGPLAWEPPYATSVVLKRQKIKKNDIVEMATKC